ncbi:MAG: poly-gamma-glutamate biosynthesis protein PgsC [Calditrichaceae bacterium]|nr:poly-gamma-glutamate biosynthesis protein PgsC [Calditrichaceae bacterium]HES58824.1 poly-gamma-glutamate biosynthesis protein PgsC [Caldithrix sp.]
MIVTAFGIGIVLGFIFFELTGLAAGGIIVPGYLALFVHEPSRIIMTILVSLITYLCVLFASRYLIIFGRRRFLLMILIGFLFQVIFNRLVQLSTDPGIELQTIGYIIPGLIANEFFRQGILKTLLAMTIVTIAVFIFLQWIYF